MNRVYYEDLVKAISIKYPDAKVRRTKYGVSIRYFKMGLWYNYRGSLSGIASRLELDIK